MFFTILVRNFGLGSNFRHRIDRKRNEQKNFLACVYFIHTGNYNPKYCDKNDQTLKVQLNKNSFWMMTPLREFGFKCIANKHEVCGDSKCKCLCHPS